MAIFVVDFYVPYGNSCRVADETPFKDRLKKWRGERRLKQAAADLDIDYPTYRKYETGKRTPCKLALAEIERRMAEWIQNPENI